MRKTEKRKINPDDISIIEHNDFNISPDGQNIFHIEVPNPGKNPVRFAKAFRAFGNVFIVPKRYLYNDYFPRDLNQPPNAKTGSVYDPSYLLTNDNKSDFLKKTTLVLKRIALVNNGQKLLKGLYNGLPLKDFKGDYQQEAFNSYATVKILNANMQPTGENLNCSLIIYGPTADCADNKTEWIANEVDRELIKNGHGSMAEIMFCPDLFPVNTGPDPTSNYCFPLEKRFVQDPVVVLFHEMKHALHINYGSYIDAEYPISNKRKSIYGDELTIVSLSDREKIKATLQSYDRKLRDSLDAITSSLNNVTTIPLETKQLYQNKYFLKYDQTSNQYSWTEDTFNDLIQSVRYATYETKFCDELGILSRKSYLSAYQSDYFRANILNEKIYTITNGFNLRGNYSGQKTTNPKLVKEKNTVAITIDICASKSKRSLPSFGLCTKIKSDKIIQIVNNDYSDYKIVHTIDNAPLVQLKTENKHTPQKINHTLKKQFPDTAVETVQLISKGIKDHYLPEKKQITVDTFSRYHILNAQNYDKTLDPKKDKIQFIDADGKDQTINSSIRDNKIFYSYFSKLNTTINTAQSFANFYLYTQWVNQLLDDFKEESSKNMSRKLGEDVIQIVPYIGAAYNVGKDMSHSEFINAFIDAGIGMLLVFSPETVIPMAVYSITTNMLQSISTQSAETQNKQKKIEDTINNTIQMRQTYIKSYTNEMLYIWWGHVYLQIEDMIYNLSQQFENYKGSMLHNITYHGLKVLETDKTASKKDIDRTKDNFEMHINIHIQNAMKNTIDMLTVGAKKYLKEEWGKKIIEKLKTYDQEVYKELGAFISNNSKGIRHSTTKNWTSKLENHFNGSGLEEIFEDPEINENINQIVYNLVARQSEDKESKILCQIDVFIGPITKEREIIDVTDQTEITGSKNIAQLRTPQGRKGYCMLFEKNQYIKLEKNALLSKISFFEDFTWNFWIRHPLEASEANEQTDVTIIQFTEDKKQKPGFHFALRNGRIYFTIKILDTNNDNDIKYKSLGGGDIQDNKWHMITVSFDSKNECLYFYKDTFLQDYTTTKDIPKRIYNANLEIGFENNNDPDFFFKIEQFKVYNSFFEKEEIQSLYYQDTGDYLYDHWGEPLRYNTPYYLNHVPLEGHETVRWKPLGFNGEYIAKNKSKNEFKTTANSKYYPNLYIGEKVIFYLSELQHEKTDMPNRALVKMKLVNNDLESCIYNKDKYLLYENSTAGHEQSNLFQLHTLQNEIIRTSETFKPYSIIMTTTTEQGYNDGAFIDYYYENKYYYNIERGDFKVDRTALIKAGKSPFIQNMEDESDNYINRFCWTFVPKDEDNGWKES